MTGIVISPSFVLSDPSGDSSITLNNPVIGWKSLGTIFNITADTELPAYPATNLANPSTNLKWQAADTTEQYVTVAIAAEADYVAIAAHNLGVESGSASVPISIEGYNGATWTELIAPRLLENNGPVIFRFTRATYAAVRVRLQTGTAAAQIAILYVGVLLALQRRIYVGHTPMPYGRIVNVTTGVSENGNFLGRIISSEMRGATITLNNLTPSWYRAYLDPFISYCKDSPFFFAWRPVDYPNEAGFGWFSGDYPQPKNQLNNGMMQIAFNIQGLA